MYYRIMEELYEKLKKHRVRFYPGQKKRFRDLITAEFNDLGYNNITIDKAKNLIVGDVQSAKVVYTAHYDTPMLSPWFGFAKIFGQIVGGMIMGSLLMLAVAVAAGLLAEGLLSGAFFASEGTVYLNIGWWFLLLTFFIPSPGNANDNTSGVLAVYEIARRLKVQGKGEGVAFVLFNSEELGLLGSGAFKKDLVKAAKKNGMKYEPKFLLVNFDCVGIGNEILLAYGSGRSKEICKLMSSNFEKPVIIKRGSLFTYGSDNLHFKDNGIMVTAVKRSLLGPIYLPRIHAPLNMNIDLNTVRGICNGAMKVHAN